MEKTLLAFLLLTAALLSAQSIKTTVNPQSDSQTVFVTLEYVPASGYKPMQFFWDYGDCPKAQIETHIPCNYLSTNPTTHKYKPGEYELSVTADDGKGNQTHAKKHIKISLPLEEKPVE